MKQCIKCKETFEDSVNFCPKCGARLIKENSCQICGSPIEEGDEFCRNCGAKLASSKSTLSKNNSGRESSYQKTITTIIASIGLIAIILAVVGMFGDILVAKYGVISSILANINYFFGEGAETISKAKTGPSNYYSFSVILFILENIFYFGGWILCFIFSVLSTKNLILVLLGKKNINFSYLYIAAFSMLPILIIFLIQFNIGGTVGGFKISNFVFGWGSILTTISASLTILCSFIYQCFVEFDVSKIKQNNKQFIFIILNFFCIALMFACLFIAFSPVDFYP